MRVYKLTIDGEKIIDDDPAALLNEAVNWEDCQERTCIEAANTIGKACLLLPINGTLEIKNSNGLFVGDFVVECLEMSKSEINALPEFEGL